MATAKDAELILKLYELRRETRMREARQWVFIECNPQTIEEFLAVQRDFGSEKNQFLRQVLSYWEMAAALVHSGALDADLFLDCNGEGISLLAKFGHLREAYRSAVGLPFMPRTAALIDKYPAAKERFDTITGFIRARRAAE